MLPAAVLLSEKRCNADAHHPRRVQETQAFVECLCPNIRGVHIQNDVRLPLGAEDFGSLEHQSSSKTLTTCLRPDVQAEHESNVVVHDVGVDGSEDRVVFFSDERDVLRYKGR